MAVNIEILTKLIDLVSNNDLIGSQEYLENNTFSKQEHPELVESYVAQLEKTVTAVSIYETDIDFSSGRIPKTRYVLVESGDSIVQMLLEFKTSIVFK